MAIWSRLAAFCTALILLTAAGKPAAQVRVLDVLTTEVKTLTIPVGQTQKEGGLSITIRACKASVEPDADAIYIEVRGPENASPDSKITNLFSGWMFAASPSLSAMDHPRYNVAAVGCMS